MVNGYKPTTLNEAVAIRAAEKVVPYAGGTDLMVRNTPGVTYLFLNDIEEIKQIAEDDNYIRIGAAVTFTQALNHDLVPPLMKEAISRIAAPAIRNAGTFGGNLANASDKADSVLAGIALDAYVRLVSAGGERIISFDDFCVRRGVTNLRDDELVAEILLPKDKCALPYYYKKVGGRNALAISHIALAGSYDIYDGVIKCFSAAVIADAGIFLRYRDIEAELVGKTLEQARNMTDEIIDRYAERLRLTRGRVSAEYRQTVMLNLLKDYIASLK